MILFFGDLGAGITLVCFFALALFLSLLIERFCGLDFIYYFHVLVWNQELVLILLMSFYIYLWNDEI